MMAGNLDPRCLTILKRLTTISNSNYPSEQHTPIHTYHNTKPITITQAYKNINDKIAKNEPISIPSLIKELPHLPPKIIQEISKCTHPIRGYHHAIQPSQNNEAIINHPRPQHPPTHALNIITWNTGCINSSLPGIQKLINKMHDSSHILLIQETKIPKTKSTTYIDRQLQDYKIIYNNSNTTVHRHNRFLRPSQRQNISHNTQSNLYK